MLPQLSIVIPALNEEECLPLLLADLANQAHVDLEVIVADGGSTDRTIERCRPFNPVFVDAPRGRARQLNAGFKNAAHDNVLFLHADSRIDNPFLLSKALDRWLGAIADAGTETIAGHFSLKFTRRTTENRMAFRYTEGKTRFNRVNTTNGDQGFLLKRSFFEALGWFDETQHFLEDQKLAESIRAVGTWITLPGRILTSGRRFETEGYHRLLILMSIIMALHTTGLKAFFTRARNIYAAQSETGRLLMKPYFRVIIETCAIDLGFWGSVRAWTYVGRYIRQNSWQMFYFLDVLLKHDLKTGTYPLLEFHDKYVHPAIDNSLCDALVAPMAFFWFMMVLAPYFYFVDTAWPEGR